MNILMGLEFHNTEREEVAIRNENCVLILMRLNYSNFFEEMAFLFILFCIGRLY
jgi:hypothetical protein